MTTGQTFLEIEHHALALGWLDVLAEFLPETVRVEVSSGLVIAALLALWIWRRAP